MRLIARFYVLVALSIGLLAAAIAFVTKGEIGVQGFALGAVATSSSLYGLWMVVCILSSDPSKDPSVLLKILLRGMVFLTSLPIFLVCMRISHGLGPVADGCFIGGLALVYLFAISWGVLRTQLD